MERQPEAADQASVAVHEGVEGLMTAGRSFWNRATREWVREDDLPPRPKPLGPIILGDSMPDANGRAVLNHADGKYYSSKSQYYAATKRAGCEITGSEYRVTPDIKNRYTPEGVGHDIQKSIAQLRSR